MNVLVDTHLALWFLDGSAKLSQRAREIMEDGANAIFVSDISLWEIAIKHAKRPDIITSSAMDFRRLCDVVGFLTLPLRQSAIEQYELLDTSVAEGIHRDPFDRMLIAQSKAENMLLLTHDRSFELYHEPLVSVV